MDGYFFCLHPCFFIETNFSHTDFAAAEAVYNAYVNDLYAYALHLGFDKDTAMDAIHDIFCKLCADKRFLESAENLKLYLFRSLKNRLIDISRTGGKEYIDIASDKQNESEMMPFHLHVTIEDELIDREEQEIIKAKVAQLLERLTHRQREIVYLRYIHGYNYDEIAQLMHISVVSCRNLLHKAMNNMKDAGSISLLLVFLTL